MKTVDNCCNIIIINVLTGGERKFCILREVVKDHVCDDHQDLAIVEKEEEKRGEETELDDKLVVLTGGERKFCILREVVKDHVCDDHQDLAIVEKEEEKRGEETELDDKLVS